eukprot:jgi/Botrbrau1/11758/Bobra.0195s0083.1
MHGSICDGARIHSQVYAFFVRSKGPRSRRGWGSRVHLIVGFSRGICLVIQTQVTLTAEPSQNQDSFGCFLKNDFQFLFQLRCFRFKRILLWKGWGVRNVLLVQCLGPGWPARTEVPRPDTARFIFRVG